MSVRSPVTRAAQAYVGHLLAGGTTTWGRWSVEHVDNPGPGGPVEGVDGGGASAVPLPGAAQAELLRRLNQASSGVIGPSLARRVLARAAPGRGMVDLRLADTPVEVPAAELVRVGTGVLADLVAEQPPLSPPVRPAVRSRRGSGLRSELESGIRRRRFRLEGPPVSVAALRARLAAAGLVEHGTRPTLDFRRRSQPHVVLVVVRPLECALAQVWSARAQRGSSRTWASRVAQWQATGLPGTAAYDRRAAAWAPRIGAGNVHLVGPPDLDEQVAAVLGRRPSCVEQSPRPAPLAPALVEVLRQTNEVLPFVVPQDRRPASVDRLVDLLVQTASAPHGLGSGEGADHGLAVGVPAAHQGWLASTAAAQAEKLGAGGYRLHGPFVENLTTAPPAQPLVLTEAVEALVAVLLRADAGTADAGIR